MFLQVWSDPDFSETFISHRGYKTQLLSGERTHVTRQEATNQSSNFTAVHYNFTFFIVKGGQRLPRAFGKALALI